MNNTKTSSTFLFTASLFFLAAVFSFLSGNSNALGSAFMCIAAANMGVALKMYMDTIVLPTSSNR